VSASNRAPKAKALHNPCRTTNRSPDPDEMRAIEISQFGAPEVLRETVRPDPVPAPGEVLVRVAAAGVNRPDVIQRKGFYAPPPGASDLPGLEVAGTVEGGDAAELAAAGLKRGDRVCALVAGGGYAELCVAPIVQTLPVPEGLSDIEAASLPETVFTVWQNVFEIAKLKAGEWLLVQGGSSGIGVTAIQLAKALGAKVIVTAGSDDKCAACVALGADHAINYKTQDFVAEVAQLTGKRGVDVILDMVAGEYVAREVKCLADDGRLAIIAVQGGTASSFDAGLVLRKRLAITGSTLRPRSVAYKTAIAQALRAQVWPLLEAGRIKPAVHAVFPAAQASDAHALMESSTHVGKIMLSW
jgi:NADPH2:quinone reductase